MLPSISNILNPPDSSRFNHRSDPTHQHVTPMQEQPRLPSPAEILNHQNLTVPTYFNRTVCPIPCNRGQPIEEALPMLHIPLDHSHQLVYAENRAYPGYINPSQTAFDRSLGGYPINTSNAAPTIAGMPFHPTSNATYPLGTRDRLAISFSHPIPGCMAQIAAVIPPHPGTHPPSDNTEQDARAPPIFLSQTRNTEDCQNHPQETQHLREESRSIHQTSLPSSPTNGQPPSAASTRPESAESDNSSLYASPTPQTPEQADTLEMSPAPAFSSERLFVSREELDLRKLSFSRNLYPRNFPIISPKKRSRPYDSLSYQRCGSESPGSDTDSEEESPCKRVKTIKTSQPAPELLLEISHASSMGKDNSFPGSDQIPSSDSQRHPNPPTSGDRSSREGEGQMAHQKSEVPSVPKSQKPASSLRSESAPTNRRSDQRKRYTSKTFSSSGTTSKKAKYTAVSQNDAESNEIPPEQAPEKGNHVVDQLIMQASMVKNTFGCDECNATFANEDSIVRHKRAQHTVATRISQMVKCPECSLLLRNKQNLKRHLATHGPNANHKCKVCPAKFVTERARTTHMRDVHGRKAEQRSVRDRSTRCPAKGCLYASNQKTNVKRHYENRHLNIKRFHCTIPACEYVGSTRANRQAHMKTHEGEAKT